MAGRRGGGGGGSRRVRASPLSFLPTGGLGRRSWARLPLGGGRPPRRAHGGGGHSEGAENLLAHEVLPRFGGDLLGHVAGDGEAGVGVDELRAGGRFGRFRCDVLEEESARARGRALVLLEFAPQLVLFELTGCAAAVGEELFERDGLVLGVHGFLELGERLAERLTPFQFSFI